MVSGNAYITVGDPYHDRLSNPFRARKKGEKEPNPFRTTVSSTIFVFVLSTIPIIIILDTLCHMKSTLVDCPQR